MPVGTSGLLGSGLKWIAFWGQVPLGSQLKKVQGQGYTMPKLDVDFVGLAEALFSTFWVD